jgi:hypothetical protein
MQKMIAAGLIGSLIALLPSTIARPLNLSILRIPLLFLAKWMLSLQGITLTSRMTAFAHEFRGSLCRLAASTAKLLTFL